MQRSPKAVAQSRIWRLVRSLINGTTQPEAVLGLGRFDLSKADVEDNARLQFQAAAPSWLPNSEYPK